MSKGISRKKDISEAARLAKIIEGFKSDVVSTSKGTGAARIFGAGHSTKDAPLVKGMDLRITANAKDHITFYDQLLKAADLPEDIDLISIEEANKAVEKMDSLAREDTGRLKKSIGYEFASEGGVVFHSQAINERGQDYAPMQEFGTRFKRGKYYFRPGVTQFLENMISRATKLMNDIRFGKRRR